MLKKAEKIIPRILHANKTKLLLIAENFEDINRKLTTYLTEYYLGNNT